MLIIKIVSLPFRATLAVLAALIVGIIMNFNVIAAKFFDPIFKQNHAQEVSQRSIAYIDAIFKWFGFDNELSGAPR